jgi:hypothetical protein
MLIFKIIFLFLILMSSTCFEPFVHLQEDGCICSYGRLILNAKITIKGFCKISKYTMLKFLNKYRVIHKSLRDFRPLRYSSRDGHAEGEHVNRGRDTPSFYPTLQVLDKCTLGDAADVNPVIKFLRHALQLLVMQYSPQPSVSERPKSPFVP